MSPSSFSSLNVTPTDHFIKRDNRITLFCCVNLFEYPTVLRFQDYFYCAILSRISHLHPWFLV